jgi:hypothetical protein
MTRVYVIAPLDLNFKVQYPKLGPNRSGFVQNEWRFEPRIMDFVDAPAYAVDDAIGQSVYYPTSSAGYYQPMRVWRATYTNSNSAEDILITVSANRGMGLRTFLRQQGPEVALIVGLIVAVLFWILAWYFLVPRLMGRNFSAPGLWRISLTYIAWNLLLFLPGGILYLFFFRRTGSAVGLRGYPLRRRQRAYFQHSSSGQANQGFRQSHPNFCRCHRSQRRCLLALCTRLCLAGGSDIRLGRRYLDEKIIIMSIGWNNSLELYWLWTITIGSVRQRPNYFARRE